MVSLNRFQTGDVLATPSWDIERLIASTPES